MRSMVVSPSASKPAITSPAEARKSDAITVAPLSLGTALTTADFEKTLKTYKPDDLAKAVEFGEKLRRPVYWAPFVLYGGVGPTARLR